jgi:hypothetical protein
MTIVACYDHRNPLVPLTTLHTIIGIELMLQPLRYSTLHTTHKFTPATTRHLVRRYVMIHPYLWRTISPRLVDAFLSLTFWAGLLGGQFTVCHTLKLFPNMLAFATFIIIIRHDVYICPLGKSLQN